MQHVHGDREQPRLGIAVGGFDRFFLVFENLARLCIHSDFINVSAALDGEGIAKTATTLLAL